MNEDQESAPVQQLWPFKDEDILTTTQTVKYIVKFKQVNTVKNHIKANKLIGYLDSGKMQIPAWQFMSGGVLPQLDYLISIVGANGLDAVNALETKMVDYDDKPAYEFVREGQVDKAIEMIKKITGG